jgi:hypothetical protein
MPPDAIDELPHALGIAADLRRKADLCRQMAAVSTSGGRYEDRRLRDLARQFDREAAQLEQAQFAA